MEHPNKPAYHCNDEPGPKCDNHADRDMVPYILSPIMLIGIRNFF